MKYLAKGRKGCYKMRNDPSGLYRVHMDYDSGCDSVNISDLDLYL